MKSIYVCDDCHPDKAVEFSREHGCGIEVQSFFDPKYILTIADAVEEHQRIIAGIAKRSLHGAFADLCAGSMDDEVRRVTRDRFEQSVAVADKLDIRRLILHHGYIPGTSPPDGWLKRYQTFWGEFLEDKPANMYFHLENVHESDPGLLGEIIATIDDERVGICLDIGHVHCHAKVDILNWIRQLNRKIEYVHLHDNHGEADEHLGLGQGTMSITEVCQALEEHAPDAIWALEVGPDNYEQSFGWLKEKGFI